MSWKRYRNIIEKYGFDMGVCKYLLQEVWRRRVRPKEIEEKKSFGILNEDKTLYVIRMSRVASSLGPMLLYVLSRLRDCEKRGYVPVVDFGQFDENTYQEIGELAKINTWLYFFDQPTFLGLDAAYYSRHVILGNPLWNHGYDTPHELLDHYLENLSEYCEIWGRYIHINGRLLKKYSYIDAMISQHERVLGVAYRGTDYRNRKVIGEHKQPSLDDEIRDAEELMAKWKCDSLFLTTEDEDALNTFKKIFGNKLLYIEKQRFPGNTAFTYKVQFDRDHDLYFRGEEYLAEMYALSRCHCLLAPRAGYLLPTLCMNNQKYLHVYIYNLGLYTEEDYK